MSWIVLMSSSSTPSLGVVSVTMTLPGPWTVIVHLSPARSVPETILPSLLKPGLLGLLGLTRLGADEELSLMGDRIGHEQIRWVSRATDNAGTAEESSCRLSRASGLETC